MDELEAFIETAITDLDAELCGLSKLEISKDINKALALAVIRGANDLLETLLTLDVNTCNFLPALDGSLETLISKAIFHNNKRAVELLLQNNVNPDVVPPGSVPAIWHTILDKDPWYLKTLLEHGVSPNTKDELKKVNSGLYGTFRASPLSYCMTSPYGYARRHGYHKLLLEHGADANVFDGNGLSPLMLAAKYGYSEGVSDLIAHGADVSQSKKFGQTALYIAAEAGQVECIKLLLTAGANPEAFTKSGMTPLMIAAKKHRLKAVITLLDYGVNVEARDKNGKTALMYGVKNKMITHALMKAGEQINASDIDRAAYINSVHQQVYANDIQVLKRLAAQKSNARFIFEILAMHEKATVRELVAKNTECPSYILDLLATDRNNDVKLASIQNYNHEVGPEMLGKNIAPSVKELRNKGKKRDRVKIARETTKIEILEDLAQDRGFEVRLEVVKNPNTSVAILNQLAKDSIETIRAAVANRHNTPDETLDHLINDDNETVRYNAFLRLSRRRSQILENINESIFDETFFEKMMGDSCELIRRYIAKHTVSPDIQERLLMSGSESIKRELASNKSLDNQLLDKLKYDESTSILCILLEKTSSEEVYIELMREHDALAKKANTNYLMLMRPSVQRALSSNSNPMIRKSLAMCTKDSDLLLKLANDKDISVRKSVAHNEYILDEHVKALMKHEINDDILLPLYQNKRHEFNPYIQILVKHESEMIRAFFARYLHLDSALEKNFIEDESILVRNALIKNETGTLSSKARRVLRRSSK